MKIEIHDLLNIHSSSYKGIEYDLLDVSITMVCVIIYTELGPLDRPVVVKIS